MNLINPEQSKAEQEKKAVRKLANLEVIKLEKEEDKEKILEKIRNQLSICHGTGKDKNFVDPKTGEIFYDCNGETLEEYNRKNNENLKIDERLVKFIYNEFLLKGYEAILTSGFRCPEHNNYSAAFDGTGATKKLSKHCLGQAMDLILKKEGEYLDVGEYNDLIEQLEKKYRFSDQDYKEIRETDSSLDQNRKTLFFTKSYNIGEGEDPDNYFQDKKVSYLHFDFRGIDPDNEFAKKYYQENNLI